MATPKEDKSMAREVHGKRDDGCEFAIAAARLIHDSKTEDVSVLDLRGLSNLADFFVIGTGTSDRQMKAVLDEIHDYAKTVGRSPFTTTARGVATWLLADYVDVVVHMFDEEHRSYYDLDGLWGDAPRVVWQRETDSGAS
jgi:ribosome-associated protein